MNKRGSALIMVIICTAVIGIAALSIMALISSMEKQSATRRKQESFQEIIKTLNMRMQDPMDCTAILAGQAFSLTSPTSKQNIVLKTTYGKDAEIPANYIKAGKVLVDDIQLSKVEIQAVKDPKIAAAVAANPVNGDMRYAFPALTPPANARLKKYYVEIKLYTNSMSWNANSPDKAIRVYIKVRNTTGIIAACHGPDSPAETCEVVSRGTYNPNLPTAADLPTGMPLLSAAEAAHFRCNPDRKCFSIKSSAPDGLFTTANCPNDPVTGIRYSAFYKAQLVGELSGVKKYICNWCNPNR